jgi:hypothetical protein
MNDAVRYLLPAIPTLLYGGLGRHQVDRLAVLRKACERTWERRALGRNLSVDFATLFQDVLSQFDTQPDNFSPQRVQDELVGQMAELLEADYDTLAWRSTTAKAGSALTSEPAAPHPATPVVPRRQPSRRNCRPRRGATGHLARRATGRTPRHHLPLPERPGRAARRAPAGAHRDAGPDHRAPAVHPAHGGRSIGDKLPDFEADALRAIPCRSAGSTHLGCLVHRAGPGRAGSPARAYRAVRSRDRREAAVATSSQRRRHRLRLRGAGRCQAKALPAFARAVLTLLRAEHAPAPDRGWTRAAGRRPWRRCCMARRLPRA